MVLSSVTAVRGGLKPPMRRDLTVKMNVMAAVHRIGVNGNTNEAPMID